MAPDVNMHDFNDNKNANYENLRFLKRCQESTNEHGLLVLAKSDLKLSYLMMNNDSTIKTMLRSQLLEIDQSVQSSELLT